MSRPEPRDAALTSVIIPCWNALDLSRVCLEQLARRTTRPYELVIVDNGSADGTAAWLRAFRRRASRASPGRALRAVRVLSNAENRGYPAAMNQGIRASRGRLLLFGNADVAATPRWLERMQEALSEGGPRAAGVSALCNPARRQGEPIGWARRPWYEDLAGLERYAAALELSAGASPAFVPAGEFFGGFWFLARRAAIEEVGPFDERYGQGGFEDFDMQWRLRLAGWRLGFAAKSYVHHVGFGCGQRNGLSKRAFYGRTRAAAFFRKFPEAPAGPMFR